MGISQHANQKSHSVLRKCNVTSRLNRFITSQNSNSLKGQKVGRGKSANGRIITSYGDSRKTFGSHVGKYPVIVGFPYEATLNELRRWLSEYVYEEKYAASMQTFLFFLSLRSLFPCRQSRRDSVTDNHAQSLDGLVHLFRMPVQCDRE
jgi:hypothetical protein